MIKYYENVENVWPVENHTIYVFSTVENLSRFSEVTTVLHLIWWCVKQNTAHMFALN